MDAQENDEAEDDDLVSSTSVQDQLVTTVVVRLRQRFAIWPNKLAAGHNSQVPHEARDAFKVKPRKT